MKIEKPSSNRIRVSLSISEAKAVAEYLQCGLDEFGTIYGELDKDEIVAQKLCDVLDVFGQQPL